MYTYVNGLSSILKSELATRNMTIREFSRFSDIPLTTVAKMLDPNSEGFPSLETLRKLNIATRIPLSVLIRAIMPDMDAGSPDAESVYIARQI